MSTRATIHATCFCCDANIREAQFVFLFTDVVMEINDCTNTRIPLSYYSQTGFKANIWSEGIKLVYKRYPNLQNASFPLFPSCLLVLSLLHTTSFLQWYHEIFT